MSKKSSWLNWLDMKIGIMGVFLLFTSDLYGFDDSLTLTVRGVGLGLIFLGIFMNWLLFYFTRKK